MIVEIVAPIRGDEHRKSKVNVSNTPFEATMVTLKYLSQRGSVVFKHLLVSPDKYLPRIPEKLQSMMMILSKNIVDEHIINTLIANELTHLNKDDEVRISLPLPTA